MAQMLAATLWTDVSDCWRVALFASTSSGEQWRKMRAFCSGKLVREINCSLAITFVQTGCYGYVTMVAGDMGHDTSRRGVSVTSSPWCNAHLFPHRGQQKQLPLCSKSAWNMHTYIHHARTYVHIMGGGEWMKWWLSPCGWS